MGELCSLGRVSELADCLRSCQSCWSRSVWPGRSVWAGRELCRFSYLKKGKNSQEEEKQKQRNRDSIALPKGG